MGQLRRCGKLILQSDYEKGRPGGRPQFTWRPSGRRRRGLFGMHRGFFALDVIQTPFFLNFFVQLFAHKCLYFVRGMRFRYPTMKVYWLRFNIYLVLLAVLLSAAGCETGHGDRKKYSLLRVNIEVNADRIGGSQPVLVVRAAPVSINIGPSPILTEENVLGARVLDTTAGFGVEVQLDSSGTLLLEQYTAANQGKHLVVYGQWGEKDKDGRWIGAPLITHRITDGLISFTPDMSHDDAYRWVLGLNNIGKKNAKEMTK